MTSKLFLCLWTLLLTAVSSSLGSKTNVVVKKKARTTSSAAINGLKNSVASGLAAACSKTALAPFDTIKTVQQQTRVDGGKALGLIKASKAILSRPGGIFELYVSDKMI